MSEDQSFGQLVKAHRRQLSLTQDELAWRVGCAPVTLRKIEYDDLRPSVQIAERLAMALNLPLEQRAGFVRQARLERALGGAVQRGVEQVWLVARAAETGGEIEQPQGWHVVVDGAAGPDQQDAHELT